MITPTLRHYVIGAILLHTALIAAVIAMPPPAQTPMRVMETFLIAPPGIKSVEKKQLISPHAGTTLHPRMKKRTPLPPVTPLKNHPSLPSDRKVVAAEAPLHNTANSQELPPTESRAPAPEGLATTPIPLLSSPPQEKGLESLSALSPRQNPATRQVMMMGEDDAPRFIQRVVPIYPYIARKFGKEGAVLLMLTLDTQGQLQGIEIVEENGFGFAEAARAAIKKSTFAPAVRDGNSIPSKVLVAVSFVLHEGS